MHLVQHIALAQWVFAKGLWPSVSAAQITVLVVELPCSGDDVLCKLTQSYQLQTCFVDWSKDPQSLLFLEPP